MALEVPLNSQTEVYNIYIIPSVFILGCINALPRKSGYVSGLRPSSNPYMLEVHKYSLK